MRQAVESRRRRAAITTPAPAATTTPEAAIRAPVGTSEPVEARAPEPPTVPPVEPPTVPPPPVVEPPAVEPPVEPEPCGGGAGAAGGTARKLGVPVEGDRDVQGVELLALRVHAAERLGTVLGERRRDALEVHDAALGGERARGHLQVGEGHSGEDVHLGLRVRVGRARLGGDVGKELAGGALDVDLQVAEGEVELVRAWPSRGRGNAPCPGTRRSACSSRRRVHRWPC